MKVNPSTHAICVRPNQKQFVSIVLHRTAWHVLSITVVPHELVHANEDDVDVHLSLAVGSDDANGHMIGDPIIYTMSEVAIRREFNRLEQEEDQRKCDYYGGVGSRYAYIKSTESAPRTPKEVRNQLAKLHGHFAHPSNDRLARMLQIDGAPQVVIDAVKNMKCSIYERVSRPRSAPQASAKAPSRFNEQATADSVFFLAFPRVIVGIAHISLTDSAHYSICSAVEESIQCSQHQFIV